MPRYNRKAIKTINVDPNQRLFTVAEIKNFVRVTENDDDELIDQLIKTATEDIKEYTRRAILTTTLELTMDGFTQYSRDEYELLGPGVHTASKDYVLGLTNYVDLPYPPIQSVTSIKTYDRDNTESTVTASTYNLDEQGGRIYLDQGESWPSNLRGYDAVKIRYVAGYGSNRNDVPMPIVHSIRQYVADMYNNRGDCEIPMEVKRRLEPYKLYDELGYS